MGIEYQYMQTKLLFSDRLCALFVFAQKQSPYENVAFRASNHKLEKTFLELIENEKNQELLKIIKSKNGTLPSLYKSLERMQLGGIIARRDITDPELLFLQESVQKYYKNYVKPRLSEEEISDLENLAREFSEKIEVIKTKENIIS